MSPEVSFSRWGFGIFRMFAICALATMCVTNSDADFLNEMLDEVLGEVEAE